MLSHLKKKPIVRLVEGVIVLPWFILISGHFVHLKTCKWMFSGLCPLKLKMRTCELKIFNRRASGAVSL